MNSSNFSDGREASDDKCLPALLSKAELINHVDMVSSKAGLGDNYSCNSPVWDGFRETSYQNDIEKADEWLFWSKSESHLRAVTADIPVGILPDGVNGKLIDVKVNPRGGPDDALYDSSAEYREKVARGNCFVRLSCDKGPRCVVRGMKKFTGGMGDDDDRSGGGDNFTWKSYFIKPLDRAEIVIATNKANGESGHLSCTIVNGSPILCAGSKNVHLLFHTEQDIRKYTEDRFQIATKVALAALKVVSAMDAEKRRIFYSFLVQLKLTAVFEMLQPDYLHVEDNSALKEPLLKFITWTSIDLSPPKQFQLATFTPRAGIEMARSFGFDTIGYEVIPIFHGAQSDGALSDHVRKTRNSVNEEGIVYYFLDDEGSVMGVLKKKSVWYILCRAIREKSKLLTRKIPPDYASITNSVTKRFRAIQQWVKLSDNCIESWKDLCCGYIQWCKGELATGSVGHSDIHDLFPVLWKRYLKSSHQEEKVYLVDFKEAVDDGIFL